MVEIKPLVERSCLKCKRSFLGMAVICPECGERLQGWKKVGAEIRDDGEVVAQVPGADPDDPNDPLLRSALDRLQPR